MLRVQGDAVVDADGARVLLRGAGLGGWMNMENFITGYPANEWPA
jgi:endoglucanase